MPTPANALQAAIYTRLNGYSTLTSLIGSNQVFDNVPETAAPPYVLVGDDTAIDWSTKNLNGWETTITIHCWDYEKSGRKSVKAIMSAIYDALHDQNTNITVTGFNLIMIRCEFERSVQETSVVGQGNEYYHGIQRYRVLIHS